MVTPIINGNAVICKEQQFLGFWRNLTKRATLKENLFENPKGRIHLAKESGDGLSSLIKF